MIKNAPDEILHILHRFINLCLGKSLIPHSWCLDLINPILKDGNQNDPNNYRGICISSALLKIICSLLNNRILTFCAEQKLISENQIGFKKDHRTSDHLLTLKCIVKKYVTIGKGKLFACFIDFKKAYDSVWHKGLFYKLQNFGFVGKALELIKDIYSKTKAAVKSGNGVTEFFTFTKGVRQGCPMSPILFNLFVNDIFEIMNKNSSSDISLDNGNKLNALMYADDLILLSQSKEDLQKKVDILEAYCNKWKLNINEKKSKVMVFNRGNKLIKTDIKVNNTALENVKTFKYLGFSISAKNCSFLPTIENLSTRASRAIFALNNRIKLSKLPKRLAVKVFNSQIVPILTYGSEVWGPYLNYDFLEWDKSKIEQVQTQYLKRVLGCNIHTSNIMARGEIGARPLLVGIIKKVLLYHSKIIERDSDITMAALNFENRNDVFPNFSHYTCKFNLNTQVLLHASKDKINKAVRKIYDDFWWSEIIKSPKAAAYALFKNEVCFEEYLFQVKNTKHRNVLSRFRLSNHNLMIESGRHCRPKIDKNERFCFFCKNKIENEVHFVTECPLYNEERDKLYVSCRTNARDGINFDLIPSHEQIFTFILRNNDANITNSLAKFVYNSFLLRDKAFYSN